jgi:hypothetical protein
MAISARVDGTTGGNRQVSCHLMEQVVSKRVRDRNELKYLQERCVQRLLARHVIRRRVSIEQ